MMIYLELKPQAVFLRRFAAECKNRTTGLTNEESRDGRRPVRLVDARTIALF